MPGPEFESLMFPSLFDEKGAGCCLAKASIAPLLNKNIWILRLIGDEAQPNACDRNGEPLLHRADEAIPTGVVRRSVKNVGREPSWCWLNSEYHKALAPFFIPS